MNLEIQRGKTISRFVEACRDGNLPLVQQVYHKHSLKHAADPSHLLHQPCPLTHLTGLHAAAEFNRLPVVQWYLHTHPSPQHIVNLPCHHSNVHATPLHYAARAGRHDIIEWLLQNTIAIADKHPLDGQGKEPLDWCMERRRDHCEYLFRDLATQPRSLSILDPGRHRHLQINAFDHEEDVAPGEEDPFQHEWYKRSQGTYVSAHANAMHPTWLPPVHLGGLPLLGYNIYCRRLRTYIPPLDQTIEGNFAFF